MKKTLTSLVKLSKNKYIEKDTGYLYCENAILGSVGYQDYLASELSLENFPANKIIRVYRPKEEVFAEESLATLDKKAIVLFHPDEKVNSSNDSYLRKGIVCDIKNIGNEIQGTLLITDKATIDKTPYINKLSLGYDMELEPLDLKADIPSYIARNIRYNHIAIVYKGRSKIAQIQDACNEDIEKYVIEDNNLEKGGNVMGIFSKKNVEDKEIDENVKDNENTPVVDEVLDDVSKENSEIKKDEESTEKSENLKEETVKEDKDNIKDSEDKKDDIVVNDKDIKEQNKMENENKVNIKDSATVTLTSEQFKQLIMESKGKVYANDEEAFKKVELPKIEVKDAELERKNYYRNTLNLHKNKDFKNELQKLSDLISF